MEKSPENTEYEKCIMCGEITNIPISMSIEYRQNYVLGLGQVCEKCQSKLDLEVRKNIDYYLYNPEISSKSNKSKTKKSRKPF